MTPDFICTRPNGPEVEQFERWLNCMPSSTARQCMKLLTSDAPGVWLLPPLDELAHFRMDASRCLETVLTTLRDAYKLLAPPGRVIWALENRENRGLDDFEAEAVFGTMLDIDLLEQANRGESISQILLAGRVRDEIIGLSFVLESAAVANSDIAAQSVRLLLESGIGLVTIFVDDDTAVKLLAKPEDPLTVGLRLLLKRSGASLGLWIPSSPPINSDMHDLVIRAGALRKLAGSPVDHVRFAEFENVNSNEFFKVIRAAKLKFDSSFAVAPPDDDCGQARGPRPYAAGVYQPQPFDCRVPAGLWRDDAWLECPSWPIDGQDKKSNLQCFWKWRLGIDEAELSRLLDFRRMEAFFIVSETTPIINQHYHRYRVYNWPSPPPSPRVTLLDCGGLDEPRRIESLLNQLASFQTEMGPRWRVVAHEEFFKSAELEARRRTAISIGAVLDHQIRAHEYLGSVASAPLREEIFEFLRFIPDNLGKVLELGSGNGQLAQALNERCDWYTCADLSPHGRAGDDFILDSVAANIHELPFRNETFQTVVANNVLEHLYDPIACLTEVARVLRPGGRLYALIPLDLLNPKYQIRSHLWKADEESIHAALNMGGLKPLRTKPINLYSLGIVGAFPSCNGLVCAVEASRD